LLSKSRNVARGDRRLKQNTALTCLRPDYATEGLHVSRTQQDVRSSDRKIWRGKACTASGNVQERDASVILNRRDFCQQQ
jgi:hypothetical protein